MKSFLSIAALCCVAALAGCNNNKTDSAAPGAVGEKCASECGANCCKDKASMGAVGEKSECCAEKAKASMGAVSEKTDCASSCSGAKTECTGASMGAVSEKKDCSATKTDCTAGASLGAVSEKATCTKTCPMSGN